MVRRILLPQIAVLISLFSFLLKIFECLILNILVSFFEKNNVFVPTQFGFCHNHSTFHPILDILTDCFNNIHSKKFSTLELFTVKIDCLDNIHCKKFSTLIFLDIKKAFDSVCHKKLNLKSEIFMAFVKCQNELLQSYWKK